MNVPGDESVSFGSATYLPFEGVSIYTPTEPYNHEQMMRDCPLIGRVLDDLEVEVTGTTSASSPRLTVFSAIVVTIYMISLLLL